MSADQGIGMVNVIIQKMFDVETYMNVLSKVISFLKAKPYFVLIPVGFIVLLLIVRLIQYVKDKEYKQDFF